MSLPGPGPNGGILIRSAPTGPLVEVGAPGTSSPATAQFANAQATGAGWALVTGSTIALPLVQAGAIYLVRSTLTINAFGAGIVQVRAVWDDVALPGPVWTGALWAWPSFGEFSTGIQYTLEFQTPPAVGQALLNFTLEAQNLGIAASVVDQGHMLVQRI